MCSSNNVQPQAEQRFQRIVELSREHVTLRDGQGKLIYANPVQPLLGYTLADYLQLDAQSLVHPDDWAKAQTFWSAVYATPQATNTTQLRYRYSQGQYVWVEITATNLLDDPAVCAVLTYHRRGVEPTIEQQQMQRELAEEHNRLRIAYLQSAANDAIITADLNFRIQSWNQAAEHIYGWRAEEVIDHHIDEVLHTRFAAGVQGKQVLQALYAKEEWNGEVSQRHKDGHLLHILASAVIFKDAQGVSSGIVLTQRDISEQKKTNQLLQAKHAEELEFQKKLQILHEISIELTLIDDLDEFYKQVVQFGLTRLGFDRMALFLYDAPQNQAVGTYGTDQTGQLRAEHTVRFTPDPTWEVWKALDNTKRFHLEENVPLYDSETVVGKGWLAVVTLWHGNQILGCLLADNLLHQRPITRSQPEILAQYGMYVAASLSRKQIKAALRASEEKFRRLLEAAPIATLITEPSGQITLINERAEALFGYSRDALLGQPITLLVPSLSPNNLPEPPIAYPGSLVGSEPERYARRKDGSEFPIEVEQSHVQTQFGPLLLTFVLDITERKQAADALEGQRRFLRKVIDVNPNMIFVKDCDGRFVLANLSVVEIYNTTVTDLLGKRDADFNPSPQEVATFLEADRKVITSGEPYFQEEPLTKANGETRWLQTTKVPLVSVDGKAKYVLGVATDITERRRTEEALRHSENLLRTMVDHLPVAVWLLDATGTVTQRNPAGVQLWGNHPDVLEKADASLTKAWSADTSQPLQPDEWGAVQALSRGKTILNQELEVETYDGRHKYILNFVIPLWDTEQKLQGVIVVNQDITERKQNEKLIRQALEKEKELGELKSRFVSMASHEFRTPLAVILALTETLAAYWPKLTEQEINHRFDRIKEQVGRLRAIIDDVLQLTRMQANRLEFHPVPLNLHELCRKVIDEFHYQLKFEQQIEYQCADAPTYLINADPKLLHQLINNLLSNAIKYSPNNKPVRVNLDHTEQGFVLAIRDEGIGIPEADMKHLFVPFHRASNVGTISGTGLGMVITKEAVELHGGRITVESRVGFGSTFTVSFPTAQPL